ncbi:MAG: two-component system, OmpR family, sensor histidine kinase KdpD [Actinomycetota bacterium]|nr:two-component system, OmpR family, sensor histidine kinase KdpD [Actinomycetota bacterium]
MARGDLRVYLGAAPGVGKTFAMLNEGRRRHDRGTDVVVGFVETHGRARTIEQIGDLEQIPRRTVEYRGGQFEEMDLDAVLARHPEVALVDELAHTNVPGSRNEKRWQDVEELLEAGIDVVSTVNIQHLESVNDVVERITGVQQRETLPDEVVRRANQVELVDSTPEALRRRMAHGNIYKPEKVDAALANYFRPGNLAALRELALLWVADKVDESLQRYMEDHGITAAWETRERVVVALTGAPGGEHLVRRASRIATRAKGDLLGVHVRAGEGLAGPPPGALERHRSLLEDLGGTYHEIVGADPSMALVDFARAERATQLVMGSSRRSRWGSLLRGSVINRVVRASGDIDVHIISTREEGEEPVRPRNPRRFSLGVSPQRQTAAAVFALLALPILTIVLTNARDTVTLGSDLLLYLLLIVVIAAIGGAWVAGAAAVAAFLLVNWFLTPPIHTFTISDGENVLALTVFLVVAAVVSALVTSAARRALEAARARSEASSLVRLAGALLAEDDPLPSIMHQLISTFSLRSVAVLRPVATNGWSVEVHAGEAVIQRPEDATATTELPDDAVFAYVGPNLSGDDRRVLNAFVAQLAVALAGRALRAEASTAVAVAEADALRTALLRAVSHDLRTPLASIKASASTLLADDLHLDDETVRQLHQTIDEEVDRLNEIVSNLLAMSRLQVGALQLASTDVGIDEIVGRALVSLGDRAGGVVVDVPDSLPRVHVDPALAERALANVVDNALAWSPPDVPVRVEGAVVGDQVLLRVIDRGPGIAPADRDRVFQPFQRLSDSHNRGGAGVGLGLAVARGFTEAIGGELQLEDTPGGGATMTFSYRASASYGEPEPPGGTARMRVESS